MLTPGLLTLLAVPQQTTDCPPALEMERWKKLELMRHLNGGLHPINPKSLLAVLK
jgi:hypothetical protein